ncbi:glyceraldehyde 3-phosphate reductase [Cellulomonas marina]|uniref:L-glyceraldehyde 3-phosphate reductase n=1 Tax=Cellulomonas marina TaxID=988821 RepID=A0A1I0VKI2_9CELL|nr:glyceraldehyde 3-phosphate reductase [Cellulomonas marina]SFA76523.1 L-glyceraldehyde 3-phosphate reductase [Cellulomonas marina]
MRRAGGLALPAVSLGLWQNFGDGTPFADQRRVVLHAVDRGVFHLDLANNYGPPPGAAETTVGRLLATDLRAHRDTLVVTTKAGYRGWPGPYGEHGSRKGLLASLDASLGRLGTDHVDVFWSHRFDPRTPLEETIGALADAVRRGKARHAGISSYSARRTTEALAVADGLGLPLALHQPSYSLLNRWVERPGPDGRSLLDVCGDAGLGVVAFSPLAQGMLTDRYLDGVPAGSRAARGGPLQRAWLTPETLAHVRALDALARGAGLTLPQLAVAWVLRDARVTSVLVGARTTDQLDGTLAAAALPPLDDDLLVAVERHAVDAGINLWGSRSSDL